MSLFVYSIPGGSISQFNTSLSFTDWILGDSASIKSETGHGVYNASNYVSNAIVVRGLIEAKAQYKSGVASDANHTTVDIRSTGNITGYNAVAVYGNGTYVYNAGTLSGYNIGIYTQGSDIQMENAGSVTGQVGIYLDNVSTFEFSNTGSVSGSVGIALKGSNEHLAGTLTNGATGGIQGDSVAVRIDSVDGDHLTISNQGGISSKGFAFLCGDGVEVVINTGAINGRISLGGGNDIFDNRGGTIDGTIDGGQGNDTYYLGAASDTISDAGGNDTVNADFTTSLAAYKTIEHLTLTGTANVNGTGNALANVIYGNQGNNILSGGVDNVTDTLRGDSGNDTYVLGNGNDNVVDTSGNDTVTSTITRSLATFTAIENLRLQGSENIDAIGNALANTLTGNAGKNILDGGVDAATDILKGGAGNDTYVLSSGSDTVIDTSGIDTITSTVSRDLNSYAAIENLRLLGTLNINGNGNGLANVIFGNSGVNVLNGAAGNDTLVGGKGADKLTGGIGADIFVFKAIGDSTLAISGRDTIYDFSHNEGDKINLSGIDVNSALFGDQAFVFRGTALFSGEQGELRFARQASDTYVYGDINGDKVADFVLHFDDAITFQASDFLL